MSSQTIARPNPTDPPLSAVLHGKPGSDEVPVIAWWFLAESLKHSVLARRSVEGIATLSSTGLAHETMLARTAAEAAMHETGGMDGCRNAVLRDPGSTPTLRDTIYTLARLIVSSRPTSRDHLATAVDRYLEALRTTDC